MPTLPLVATVLTLLGWMGLRPVAAESVEREIAVGGTSRSYLLHVPATWDRRQPIPVLFVFHGSGSDPESMVEATGFDALAAATNMLVVYPRAPAPTKRFEVDPPAGRPSADVLLFDAILARLRERFPVDARRVWATGFSNGAALCYRLAAERPQVVAAIAPVAGYLPDLTRAAPIVAVPLLHVHGSADRRVAAPRLDGPSGSAVARWARWNGAANVPTVDSLPGAAGLVVRRATFHAPNTRSDTQLLLVEGADHVWSGGPAGVISRMILEFSVAHPLAQPLVAPPLAGPSLPVSAPQPLVGQPFGSLAPLRWLTPEGQPVALAAQRLTLLRWWTNACAHCVASVPALARLEERYRARGLRLVGVYHPKGARLDDRAARDYLRGLGFTGALAFDDRWTKYNELRDRGGLRQATSISVLVDAEGIVRWVHPGPRLEAGSRDLGALETLLERLLPASPPPGATSGR